MPTPASTAVVSLAVALGVCAVGCTADRWELAWVAHAGGTESGAQLWNSSIAAASDGGVFVTGSIRQPATFGEGEEHEATLVPVDGDDLFIAKYGVDGRLAWARHLRGSATTGAGPLAAAPDGGVVVAGWFRGTLSLDDGAGAEATLVADADNGFGFLAAYRADGALAWAQVLAGPLVVANALVVASDGSVGLAGYFTESVRFGAGPSGEVSLTAEYDAGFVAWFGTSGDPAWATLVVGGGYLSIFSGLVVDREGGLVAAGSFEGELVFGSGEPHETSLSAPPSGGRTLHAFVARFEPGGALAWAKQAVGVSLLTAVALDDRDNVLVTGYVWSPTTFGAGESGEVELPADGLGDAFVASYAADGALRWAIRIAGEHHSAGMHVTANFRDEVELVAAVERSAFFAPGTPEQRGFTAQAERDLVTARFLGGDGSFVDVERIDGLPHDFDAQCCAIDRAQGGALFTAGALYHQATFGRGDANETTFVAGGSIDLFVARFD